MTIDVHRHLVAKDTVQGDYIRGAQKSFAMMYRKTQKVDISDKDFTDREIDLILGEAARKVLKL